MGAWDESIRPLSVCDPGAHIPAALDDWPLTPLQFRLLARLMRLAVRVGSKVPNIKELGASIGVASKTCARAAKELEAKGFIERSVGRDGSRYWLLLPVPTVPAVSAAEQELGEPTPDADSPDSASDERFDEAVKEGVARAKSAEIGMIGEMILDAIDRAGRFAPDSVNADALKVISARLFKVAPSADAIEEMLEDWVSFQTSPEARRYQNSDPIASIGATFKHVRPGWEMIRRQKRFMAADIRRLRRSNTEKLIKDTERGVRL